MADSRWFGGAFHGGFGPIHGVLDSRRFGGLGAPETASPPGQAHTHTLAAGI